MEELLEYRQNLIKSLSDIPVLMDQAQAKVQNPLEPLEPGGWSFHQIIVHMRDVNREVYLPRLKRILAEQTPVFVNFDGDTWMADHYDPNESLDVVLNEFKEQCLSSVIWLRTLPASDWNQIGNHPTIGNHTFQWWVERTILHINEHLAQLGINKHKNSSK